MEPWFIGCIIFAALCTGVSKAGFSGFSVISVALLAWAFGVNEGTTVKDSVGFILPLLIVADLTVYPAFRKWGNWREVYPLMVTMLIGVGLGYVFLKEIPDSLARGVIGWIILAMLMLQLWRRWGNESFLKLAHSRSFGVFAGIAGGVATTLANAAGPVMQLFLLSRGFPKMEMVGIGARLFLVINIIKLPLLGNIGLVTAESLRMNLIAVPFIWIGIFVGRHYLMKVPQKLFEVLILVFALIAALRLLF